MLFAQTAAPTGWTKDTTNNDDSAIRVVTGTAGTGGTNAFSTLDATAVGTINSSVSGTLHQSPSLNLADTITHHYVFYYGQLQVPQHSSNVGSSNCSKARRSGFSGSIDEKYSIIATGTGASVGRTSSVGSTQGHTHGAGSLTVTSTFTGSANALDVKYVDVIIATKD